MGAQLQNAGQVRNWPYFVQIGVRETLLISTTGFPPSEQAITVSNSLIPFDQGPDKSGRVFVHINGVTLLMRLSNGSGGSINGHIYYRSSDGRKVYLAAVADALGTVRVNLDTFFTSAVALFADSVENVGYFGFENRASVAGTSTEFEVIVTANIGFYGDYAETDMEEILTRPHEHIGFVASME